MKQLYICIFRRSLKKKQNIYLRLLQDHI